jgi:hypothetical protein
LLEENVDKEQYRVGAISTNPVEGYFSQLKGMLFGTQIFVSGKYL